MAQERFTLAAEPNTSATADTNVFVHGLISGTTKMVAVYDFLSAVKAAANDTRNTNELIGTSTAITAGTGETPQNLTLGGPASVFTASTAPTGATVLAQPFIRLMHNGRATARWSAVDPDSRVFALAGGGANGDLLVVNRNSGAAAIATLAELWVAE